MNGFFAFFVYTMLFNALLTNTTKDVFLVYAGGITVVRVIIIDSYQSNKWNNKQKLNNDYSQLKREQLTQHNCGSHI